MRTRSNTASGIKRRRHRPLQASRPSKRQRCASHNATLLDLPDDVLVTILKLLQVPPSFGPQYISRPYGARYLSFLRTSFALAATCTRLMSLFGRTLDAIDAQQPVSLRNRGAQLPACASPRHLTHTVTIAAESLHVLRLPRFFFSRSKTKARQLLKAVGEHCPAIHEISFADEGLLNSRRLAAGIAGSQLRKVEISRPGVKVLKSLRLSSCQLTDLALLDVEGPSITELEGLLERNSATLVNVRIGLDKPLLDLLSPFQMVDSNTTRAFLIFLSQLTYNHMPLLESLDIEIFMATPPEELYEGICAELLFDVVTAIRSFIDRTRTVVNNGKESRLKKLRVHGLQCRVIQYVQVLTPLLLKTARVEIEFPGMAVVFPAGTGIAPYLRSVQLSNSFLTSKELYGGMLGRIEKVEVNSVDFDIVHRRPDADWVLSRPVAPIKEIIIRGRRGLSEEFFKNKLLPCRCITFILSIAPEVRTLSIPSELFIDVDMGLLEGMLSRCGKLEVLHIYESGVKMVDAFTGERKQKTWPLIQCLSWLLRTLPFCCPDLQTFYLEEAGHFGDSVSRKRVKQTLSDALVQVNRLERTLPLLDAGSVRAQLERWMGPPY